jgi:Tol biopolymer transport system component
MPTERFDRQLPELLEELSPPRTPDWFDDFVGLTARTRQRPAWTLPERWIPMTEIARQPVLAPRLPLRPLAVGLLAIAVATAAVLAVASQRRPPAPPFGVARTGLVAFDRDGDIYVADPRNGTAHAIVTGPDIDVTPMWSLDGTMLAFERRPSGESHLANLFVAKADGTEIVRVTPEALVDIHGYAFSPDGRQILITIGSDRTSVVYIAQTDGSGIRQLTTGEIASDPTWRPPDGREILFVGSIGFGSAGSEGTGIYAIDTATGAVRPIREREADHYQGVPQWSPDGTHIAYSEWLGTTAFTTQVHVVGADATGDRVLPLPAGSVWADIGAWSNDSRQLVILRGTTDQGERFHAAIVDAYGGGPGMDVAFGDDVNTRCCWSMAWAPDDSFILGTTNDASGTPLQQIMIDPASGQATTAPWSTTSDASIQRLAR